MFFMPRHFTAKLTSPRNKLSVVKVIVTRHLNLSDLTSFGHLPYEGEAQLLRLPFVGELSAACG